MRLSGVGEVVEISAGRGTMAAPMVAVAQLVEHQFVVLRVAGSKPVGHPKAAGGGGFAQPLHCSPLRL